MHVQVNLYLEAVFDDADEELVAEAVEAALMAPLSRSGIFIHDLEAFEVRV